MHRVGYHGRRVAQNTGYELEHYEYCVDDAAHQRDAVYLPFATRVTFRIVIIFIDISHNLLNSMHKP